jgi:hypothetical protein
LLARGVHRCAGDCKNRIRCEIHELSRIGARAIKVAAAKTNIKLQIAAFGPAELLQILAQLLQDFKRRVIGLRAEKQHADAPHPAALLRLPREHIHS